MCDYCARQAEKFGIGEPDPRCRTCVPHTAPVRARASSAGRRYVKPKPKKKGRRRRGQDVPQFHPFYPLVRGDVRVGGKGRWSGGYKEFIESDRWHGTKERFYARVPRVCRACDRDRDVDLHHVTYVRMGRERMADLVPLCRGCHDEVHERASREKRKHKVAVATREFIAECDGRRDRGQVEHRVQASGVPSLVR